MNTIDDFIIDFKPNHCGVVTFVGQRFHEIRFDISCETYESPKMEVLESARDDCPTSIIISNT